MNLQTILSHSEKRKYLKICLLKKIIGEGEVKKRS